MAHELAVLAALLQFGKQSRNVDQRFVIRSLPVYPPDELRNVLVVVAGEQRFSQRRRGERAMHDDMRRSGCGEVILRPVQLDVLYLQYVLRGDDYRLLRSPGEQSGRAEYEERECQYV